MLQIMSFKRWIILGIVAFLSIVVIVAGSTAVSFHATSTDPADGTVTDSLHTITIHYNHPLDSKAASAFSISPMVTGNATVQGSTITFKPVGSYVLDTTYHVTVKGALGTDGKHAHDLSFSFKASHEPDLESNQPVVKYLPYQTDHYQITYTANPNQTLDIHITLIAILNRPSQLPQYQADLKQDKKEALDYLNSHGLKDGKGAQLTFDPDPDQPLEGQNDEINITAPGSTLPPVSE